MGRAGAQRQGWVFRPMMAVRISGKAMMTPHGPATRYATTDHKTNENMLDSAGEPYLQAANARLLNWVNSR